MRLNKEWELNETRGGAVTSTELPTLNLENGDTLAGEPSSGSRWRVALAQSYLSPRSMPSLLVTWAGRHISALEPWLKPTTEPTIVLFSCPYIMASHLLFFLVFLCMTSPVFFRMQDDKQKPRMTIKHLITRREKARVDAQSNDSLKVTHTQIFGWLTPLWSIESTRLAENEPLGFMNMDWAK